MDALQTDATAALVKAKHEGSDDAKEAEKKLKKTVLKYLARKAGERFVAKLPGCLELITPAFVLRKIYLTLGITAAALGKSADTDQDREDPSLMNPVWATGALALLAFARGAVDDFRDRPRPARPTVPSIRKWTWRRVNMIQDFGVVMLVILTALFLGVMQPDKYDHIVGVAGGMITATETTMSFLDSGPILLSGLFKKCLGQERYVVLMSAGGAALALMGIVGTSVLGLVLIAGIVGDVKPHYLVVGVILILLYLVFMLISSKKAFWNAPAETPVSEVDMNDLKEYLKEKAQIVAEDLDLKAVLNRILKPQPIPNVVNVQPIERGGEAR